MQTFKLRKAQIYLRVIEFKKIEIVDIFICTVAISMLLFINLGTTTAHYAKIALFIKKIKADENLRNFQTRML